MTFAQTINATSVNYIPYWISNTVNRTFGDYAPEDIIVDSNGNLYVIGLIEPTNGQSGYPILFKYGSSGGLIWSKSLRNAYTDKIAGTGVALDTSENPIICGYQYNNSSTGPGFVAKYNSLDGTLLWKIELDDVDRVEIEDINVDSSNNIYVTGNSLDKLFVVKLDSNGSILWQIENSALAKFAAFESTIDSSNNLIVIGRNLDNTAANIFVVKFNSSGVIQWQTHYDGGEGTNIDVFPAGVVTDDNDNIYVTSCRSSTNITKFNSSGTFQWIRLGLSNNNPLDISCDGDNVYVAGPYTFNGTYGGRNRCIFGKISNAGSLIWEKDIQLYDTLSTQLDEINVGELLSVGPEDSATISNQRTTPHRPIFIDYAFDSIYLSGVTINNDDPQDQGVMGHFTAKMPPNGDRVGVYSGSFGYSGFPEGVGFAGKYVDFSEREYHYQTTSRGLFVGTYGSVSQGTITTTNAGFTTSILSWGEDVSYGHTRDYDQKFFPIREQTPQGPVVSDSPSSGGGTGGSIAVHTRVNKKEISHTGEDYLVSIDIGTDELGVLVFGGRIEHTQGQIAPTNPVYSVVDSKGNTWTNVIEAEQTNGLTCLARDTSCSNPLFSPYTVASGYPV